MGTAVAPGHHPYEEAVGAAGGPGHQGAATVALANQVSAWRPQRPITAHLARVLAGRGGAEHVGGDVPAGVGRGVALGVAHGAHTHLYTRSSDDFRAGSKPCLAVAELRTKVRSSSSGDSK